MAKKWYNYFVVTDKVASTEPTAGASGTPATRSATRPVLQRRVVDVVPDAQADTQFTTPVTTPTDLSEIYASARITAPAHGYTVLKVAEMLQSEHLKALPPEVKHKSILVALDAAGVAVSEIVEDAVQRDRALDTYERVLQKHLEDLRERKDVENKKLEEEINQRVAQLRAQIDHNLAEVRKEQEELVAWRVRKRQEEERIAEAVGHFVSPNPVTTGPAKDKGDTDVR